MNKNSFDFRKALKILSRFIFVTLILCFQTLSAYSQTSMEYTDADVSAFVTDLTAGTYDVYILSTSGGIYDVNNPSIPRSVIIKGKEGLASRPVLKNTQNSGTANGILRVNGSAVRDTVVFENLEFDGAAATPPLIIKSDNEAHLVIRNCYIHDATNSNGAIRMNTAGTSLDIQNTLFVNSTRRIIHPYTTGAVYGDINIQNTTFSGISAGDIVYFRSASGVYAAGNNVNIDHCTFHNINGDITRYESDSIRGTVSVTNSIFDQVSGGLKADVIDYNYLAGLGSQPSGTNTIITAPVFADPAAFNFTLLNADQVIGGDFQYLGDLSWYDDVQPPRVNESLEKIDDTHVRLSYNEIVDPATALDPINYTLSGTAGLTGNPSEVVQDGNKNFILTVGDLSGMTVGQSLVVTVTGVFDLNGNVIAENNVATYSLMDQTPPVVTIAAQTVENSGGQTVTASSNETGKIYLIMDGEPLSDLSEFEAAIAAMKGISADVTTPDADVSLPVDGLLTGTYYAWAVDSYDNISEKSTNAVTIQDNTLPVVTMSDQAVNNGMGQKVVAQSSETGVLYLVLEGEPQASEADLEAAVASQKGARQLVVTAGIDVMISAGGLVPGTYYAYAVDPAGNLSQVSAAKVTVEEFTPRVRYYEASQAGDLENDLLAAQNYDVFVLTTSGGIYQFSKYVNITAKVTIMAAEDLEKRPVLTIYRENNTIQTLRLYADGSSITVIGIEFDSGSRPAGSFPVKYAVRTQPGIGSYSFTAIDCHFRGVWQANDGSSGSAIKLYEGTYGDSIIFRNCIFEGDEGIVLNSLNSGPFGWDKFEITNCTFMNIPDEQALIITQGGENKNLPVLLDHCTFYGVGGIDQEVIITDSLNTVTLTNAIFASTTADTSWLLFGDTDNQSLVDYVNFFECPLPVTTAGGIVGTNTWDQDPVFRNPSNGDLSLGNSNLLTLGNDGLPLGDLRWADVFAPKVRPELKYVSDTELLIYFNEWVDTTSAQTASNYAISGTAGFTGNPSDVQLQTFNSVKITMENFSSKVGETIVITVTGVNDLNGNEVAEDNTASLLIVSYRPVVSAMEQTATNGEEEGVAVQSNQSEGTVYIILEGVPQDDMAALDAAVLAGNGSSAAVTAANTDIIISTSGIATGTYFAYAVSADGILSVIGTNAITITDGIPPVVTTTLQTVENGPGQFITAQSSETGFIYVLLSDEPDMNLSDFENALSSGKAAKAVVSTENTDVQVLVEGLEVGIYFVYAVDAAGNISDPASSPVNIKKSTVGVESYKDGLRIFALERKLIVEGLDIGVDYTIMVSDILGRNQLIRVMGSTREEIEMKKEGVYFIRVVSLGLEVVKPVKVWVK